MKKRLISFTLHLLILLASIGGFIALFLHWTGYYEHDPLVAYLYDSTNFHLVEIDQMSLLFAQNEVTFESAPLYGDPADRVRTMIDKGANTIILNLKTAPSDSLIQLSADNDITLLFVGASPTETQMSAYDKLWCFTQSPAYAGELLGEQIALGFRENEIMDANEDVLLDYVFYNAADTYMPTEDAIASTLLELDHYGVYTTDLYAAAYSIALSEAELAFTLEQEAAEPIESESALDSTTSEETPSDDDAVAPTVFDPATVTISLSDLSQPEVAMSIGFANSEYLADKANYLGWRDAEPKTTLACIVENYASAKALAETELYKSIVYFDTITTTEVVVAMACNAWAQTPLTNGTTYAETPNHTFVFPHMIYPISS